MTRTASILFLESARLRKRRDRESLPKIAWLLSREAGISMSEIARRLGVGASAIAMAIKRKNS
jgi:DNA-binding MarR family transcriptional regulator